MKAVVYRKYGSPDVLRIEEMAKPKPGDHEMLIKILAATVTAGDWRVRSLSMPTGFGLIARLILGVLGPRQPILGSELAGQVESIGKNVTQFKVGDAVFAFTGARLGCHVEYKCMPESGTVALKPANLSFDVAAALSSGGTTALSFFRRGKLRSGEEVLINGASGGVGTAAVQLAKHFGAKVTGVCSTANVGLVKSLGADHVIDYTQADFTRNGHRYDIIMDTAGTVPFSRSKGSLKEGGRLLRVLAGLPDMLRTPWVRLTGSKRLIAGPAAYGTEDLRFLAGLAQAGEFKPVVDRTFPLEQIVDAHRYVDTGRKKGNVIITMQRDHPPGPNAAAVKLST
jgi:NADPH:quinone reductase-like Zn-dependent oxidoreductase